MTALHLFVMVVEYNILVEGYRIAYRPASTPRRLVLEAWG